MKDAFRLLWVYGCKLEKSFTDKSTSKYTRTRPLPSIFRSLQRRKLSCA